MTKEDEHVSMFELDLFFATREPRPALRAHVAACARCAGYLEELAALQEGRAAPLLVSARAPGLARSSRSPARPPFGARAKRRPWLVPAAAAIAAALIFSLLSLQPAEDLAPAVAVKGSPAVQLLVRRGETTRVWEEGSPVRAGDVLGLRVACEDFSTVTLATPAGQGWARLEERACAPHGEAQTLPFSLLVDAAPGGERLAVVFSQGPLEQRALGGAVNAQRRDERIWVTRFELQKETLP